MGAEHLSIGLFGVVCIVCGMLIGRTHWFGAVALGLGLGAGGYAMLSLFTDDPLRFLLDLAQTLVA